MKTIRILCLFSIVASFFPAAATAENWETYDVIDQLLSLSRPSAPIVHDNYVIFSADSGIRRVGVAFAHENFANIYWFRQLLVSQDPLTTPLRTGQKAPDEYGDSGIKFYVYEIPAQFKENQLEYRLIINGLWTIDPSHSQTRRDPVSGLVMSVIRLPQRAERPNPLNSLPDGVTFTFYGPPGEIITVGGTFNSWDPFMYELKEGPQGVYTIKLFLPAGGYQYVFFYRGQRHVDPNNPRRIYSADGSIANEIAVP